MSEVVHLCLICNDSTNELPETPTPIPASKIKTEEGTDEFNESIRSDIDDGDGARLGSSRNLDIFCKLLKLSTTCTNSLLTSLEEWPQLTWSIFCGECQDLIANVGYVFHEVKRMQLQIDDSKARVETQIQQCFTDRRSRSGRLPRSFVEKFRALIVSDISKIARPPPRKIRPTRSSTKRNTRNTRSSSQDSSLRPGPKPRTNDLGRSSGCADTILGDLDPSPDPVEYSDAEIPENDFRVDDVAIPTFGRSRAGSMGGQIAEEDYNTACQSTNECRDVKPCKVEIRKLREISDEKMQMEQRSKSKPKRPYKKRKPHSRSPPPKKIKVKNPISCRECNATFQGEYRLQCHYKKVHGRTQYLTFCARCGKRFYSQQSVETHLQAQGGTCKKEQISDLMTVQLDHAKKNFKCNVCGHTTSLRINMDVHLLTHTKARPFICEVCGKGLRTKLALEQHMLTNHPDSSIPHPFACPIAGCGKLCGSQKLLDYHQKRHRQEFDFFCDQCSYKTIYPSAFKSHMAMVHEGRRAQKCPHCPATYKTKPQLQKHIYGTHTAPEDRPHKCGVCGKTFSDKYNLDRHEITQHTNLKPKKCEICNKRFAVGDYLRIHMRTHTGERRKQPKVNEQKEIC